MAEVSDQELQTMRNGMALLQQMEADPKSRAHLARAIKGVRPDVETEEDVAERYAAPVREEIGAVAAQMKEFLDAQTKRDQEAAERAEAANFETAFARLKKDGYTDEGIERIKGIMVERKIADPEAAALVFDKQNPPAQHEQASWTPATWDLGSTANEGVDLKAMFQDEERWADQEAAKTLNEIRMGKAA